MLSPGLTKIPAGPLSFWFRLTIPQVRVVIRYVFFRGLTIHKNLLKPSCMNHLTVLQFEITSTLFGPCSTPATQHAQTRYSSTRVSILEFVHSRPLHP